MKFTRYNFDIQYDAVLPCFLKGTSQLSHRHDIISYLYKILFSHVFTGARSVCLEIFLSCTVCYNTAIQHKPTSSAVRKWWMTSKLIHNVTVLLTWIQYLLSSRLPLYITGSKWRDNANHRRFSAQINISCAQVSLKNIFLCPTCTPYIYMYHNIHILITSFVECSKYQLRFRYNEYFLFLFLEENTKRHILFILSWI